MTTMAKSSIVLALCLALAMPVAARAETAPAAAPAQTGSEPQAGSSAGWLIGLASYDTLQTGLEAGLGWVAGAVVVSVGLVPGLGQWLDTPSSYTVLIPGAIGGLAGAAIGDAVAFGLTGFSPWAVEAEIIPSAPQVLIWAVSVSAFGKALAAGAIEGTSKLMDKYLRQPAQDRTQGDGLTLTHRVPATISM